MGVAAPARSGMDQQRRVAIDRCPIAVGAVAAAVSRVGLALVGGFKLGAVCNQRLWTRRSACPRPCSTSAPMPRSTGPARVTARTRGALQGGVGSPRSPAQDHRRPRPAWPSAPRPAPDRWKNCALSKCTRSSSSMRTRLNSRHGSSRLLARRGTGPAAQSSQPSRAGGGGRATGCTVTRIVPRTGPCFGHPPAAARVSIGLPCPYPTMTRLLHRRAPAPCAGSVACNCCNCWARARARWPGVWPIRAVAKT